MVAVEPPTPPTREQFIETVREAFAFLRQYGFDEVNPPPHRANNTFQVWFKAEQRFVIVRGEGYGTMASVDLEHEDGIELAEMYLVPVEDRPRHQRKRKAQVPGQLQEVREAAQRLERHGSDFLSGDLKRFRARAKPLPPYKRPRP